MSHFSVMVITPTLPSEAEISTILAPWHEFECTGINDEYVQDVDVTQECRDYADGEVASQTEVAKDGEVLEKTETWLDHALSYHGLEDKIVASEDEVDREGDHQWGYAIVKDGELIKAVNRTNPNKKWDWWLIGGRWTGFLKLKPRAAGQIGRPGIMTQPAEKGYADQALIKDIDLEGMRAKQEERAVEEWTKVRSAAKPHLPMAMTWQQFSDWIDEESKSERPDRELIQKTRTEFYEQPAVKAIQAVMGMETFFRMAEFVAMLDKDKADVIVEARNRAITTYAFIHEGQWVERGEMGWFGVSSGDMDQEEWNAKFNELIDQQPETACLTVVDCHV